MSCLHYFFSLSPIHQRFLWGYYGVRAPDDSPHCILSNQLTSVFAFVLSERFCAWQPSLVRPQRVLFVLRVWRNRHVSQGQIASIKADSLGVELFASCFDQVIETQFLFWKTKQTKLAMRKTCSTNRQNQYVHPWHESDILILKLISGAELQDKAIVAAVSDTNCDSQQLCRRPPPYRNLSPQWMAWMLNHVQVQVGLCNPAVSKSSVDFHRYHLSM